MKYYNKTVIAFLKRTRRSIKRKVNRIKKKQVASINRIIPFYGMSFNSQLRLFNKYYGEKVIYVDTKSIVRLSYIDISPNNFIGRFIFSGDWDLKHVEPLTSYSTPASRTVNHMFVKNLPFETSEQYQEMVYLLKEGKPKRNCSSIEEIKKYGENLSNVFHNIRQEGYKSQRELGGNNNDEIAIYIDRYGRLIAGNGGRHRIEIVRILNIKRIPVIVRGVHINWVRDCFSKYGRNIHYSIERGLKAIERDGVREITYSN